MPDITDFQLPGKEFERNVAALAPAPTEFPKGGIIFPGKFKLFSVNIRPTTWTEMLWIGQIKNYEDAQFIADLVYYYIGRPCFHLPNVNFNFPPLECTGTSTSLTSREMCSVYAMSIAKDFKFKSQRKELKESVKKLALEEVERVEVQRVLQQFRGGNGLAVIGGNHEGVTRNVDGLNAHVLGFDMSDSGFHLQSALTPVECSWVDTYLAGMKDYHGSLNHDAEDFCSATEENSRDCHLAAENFSANFYAMEDTAAVETGESSSNFLINDREGESFVSDYHFTHLDMSDEFITRRFPCSDGAYSL